MTSKILLPRMLPGLGILAVLAGTCLAAAPARAQVESREGIALQNEILELRQQMSQLQQFQTQAQPPSSLPAPQEEGAPPPVAGGGGGDVVAQMVVRVSALEEQMRTLEGRVSELEQAEHRDHDDLAKQIGDLAFKLGQGGGAASGGAPAQAGDGTGAGGGSMELGGGAPPPVTRPEAPVRRTPELALKQGSAALARRDYAGAEAAAREVLAGHSPRTADATFLLARAQAGQHEFKEAAGTYYAVYKANPHSARGAEALLGVSNAMIGMNNPALACQALAKLGAEFPKQDAGMRAQSASVRKRASCR